MAKYITEILQEINTDPKKIDQYKGNGALRLIFEHSFLEEKKFAVGSSRFIVLIPAGSMICGYSTGRKY